MTESDIFIPRSFDTKGLLREIADIGAVSVSLVRQSAVLELFYEAQSYEFEKKGQDGISYDFPQPTKNSKLEIFRRRLNSMLHQRFKRLDKYPFTKKVNMNDPILLRYNDGAYLGQHKDRTCQINMVCILNLSGKADFYLCNEFNTEESRIHMDTMPGNVIFMRAPGFRYKGMKESNRPYHSVENAHGNRHAYVLRQASDF